MKNEVATIKRKIQLKRQALPLIKREIEGLQERLALVVLRDRFEKKISDEFDDILSQKLDCITFLLEN